MDKMIQWHSEMKQHKKYDCLKKNSLIKKNLVVRYSFLIYFLFLIKIKVFDIKLKLLTIVINNDLLLGFITENFFKTNKRYYQKIKF